MSKWSYKELCGIQSSTDYASLKKAIYLKDNDEFLKGEQMFKVNDWVRIIATGKLTKIPSKHCSSTTLGCIEFGGQQYFSDDIELWQPKEGEWCWLNKELAKITSKDKDGYVTFLKSNGTYSAYHKIDTNFISKYCEPFIGELPTLLKDKE